MLSSAFGQLLEFLLDIEVLMHAELTKVPTTIAVTKALPKMNPSTFSNMKRMYS